MDNFSADMPWVIFHLMDQQFAVSASNIQEMVAMPKVVLVPQTPAYIRGVINLRGRVIPVMDTRLRMGMKSLGNEAEELIQLLKLREEDHENWIVELESSVQERREFKLAVDPHECAFGKWYDAYKADNRILENCLRKFDDPHKKIHAIAIEVRALVQKEDFDSAYKIINQTKEGALAEMIRLFAEARSLLRESNREIALVLEWDNKAMVVSVDSVETVEKLSVENVDNMPEATSTKENVYISGTAKRGKNDELVQLLNVGKLMGQEKKIGNEILGQE